ncbi:MAG: glutamate synthase large subunit [Candidatus Omnitrophota bacterium]|nr:glutamate synthase large subunit [Candidatus Omnitrophota bacterium]MDZ4242014.1 glutamate synthase large subunit [Candidatus Omnitrophota bacterium]
MSEHYPPKQGLYDPCFEHDSCGVGFVVNIKGKKSHEIIRSGIQILENLTHRGACGCDPETGDGAGLLIQMPDAFLRKECAKINMELPPLGEYGAGIVFLPPSPGDRNVIEEWTEHIIHEEGQKLLGWREIPHDPTKIGKVARSVMPAFKQLFIGRGKDTPPELLDIKLYTIRKRLYNKVQQSTLSQRNFYYFCSLSTKTMVYKGQLMAEQVDRFFPDLADPAMVSALAMIHSRYSTNTFPTWALAHPYRMMAHNGEINTLRGNINWMHPREMQFVSEAFGDDIKKVLPIVVPHGSDSATFDNVLEMLVLSGRSLPHAMMMMIPEAWRGHESMPEAKKAFYEYHSCLMEPWDGPASIAFTDGRYIGAVLDRNGLRPSRYWVTKDDQVIMASETGVLPVSPENVVLKERLQPGKMFLVDTQEGRIIDDAELKNTYATRQPYGQWLKDQIVDINDLPEPKKVHGLNEKKILGRQRAFGYTLEDLKIILYPMAVSGEEATGSMGADTPIAVLSTRPQPLYNYFKQLFAQVTNPPIDAIREEVIMDEGVMLGSEGNLLDETPQHCHRLRLPRPILKNKELEKVRQVNKGGLKAATLSAVFPLSNGPSGLERALEELFLKADEAIEEGYTILIISDRDVNKDNVAIPALLACAGMHHHLIRQGTRAKVSLVIETGEAREMHHFAVLIGYGANAINPYLVFETIEDQLKKGYYPPALTAEDAFKNFVKATRKGLFKVISKMGISTIQSYCGAQIFEAVGLGQALIEKYFTATPSRIGGIGIVTVAEESIRRHKAAFPDTNVYDGLLDEGGDYHWRRDGEHHQLNPQTIATLQHAVKSRDYELFKKYAKLVNDQQTNLATIRGLIGFKKANPIPLAEVEPASEIVKRFATGAMSYGSISKEAHETLAVAMNRLGGFSNTGEGGEDPERFKTLPNGDSKRSRIKQVAQGRFGVTIEYLVNADQLQIKMAQGAKPGEGGQLPGHKVSKEIAKTRYTTPGVQLISPPPHHDIYSIEDLAQLIHDLKNANPRADVSVKLVAEVGVGTVAAGVSKGKADHVLISGYEGGTGASPQTSIKHAGLPMELGIAETQQVLVMNDLRGRIRVQTDGQLKTGRDVAIAAMLGADEFGFATIALVTMGCILLRKCHLNTCSVGIATQDPELRKKFTGSPDDVAAFFTFVAEEVREIMAQLGFRRFQEMVGRVDVLDTQDLIGHWKAKGIDLTNILHKPDVPRHVAISHVSRQDHGLEKALDNKLIEVCLEAIQHKKPVRYSCPIHNTNRTVGTMLSSEIARRHGLSGLPEETIQINFEGSAGQSFGAFLSRGVTLTLEGDANDYVGKGLSGGRLVIYPPKKATFVPEKNIIVGNVVLYGAISGEVFFRGLAGERFAVRNSGAHAVVEGIGDHGCEYMTGGRVVVIGPTGRNFAAGMSGGIAYVWDKDGNFRNRCNLGMVEIFPVQDPADIREIRSLVEKHVQYTSSTVAKDVLERWDSVVGQFVKVYPVDYRRVVEEAAKAAQPSAPTAGVNR